MLLLVVSPQAKGIRNISKFRVYLLPLMQQINAMCNNDCRKYCNIYKKLPDN
jgi:hypothetical protein